MLGLRGGHIEVQFKNQHSVKVTSGGKAINDGQWHVVREAGVESTAVCPTCVPSWKRQSQAWAESLGSRRGKARSTWGGASGAGLGRPRKNGPC